MPIKDTPIKHIRINVQDFEKRRKTVTNTVLRPILCSTTLQAKFFQTSDDRTRVITIDEFQETELRKTRFFTYNQNFIASYYEIWKQVEGTKKYELEKMYFHLYDSDDNEYILLHCDPNDTDETHHNYKRSPHLHIEKTSETLIKKAHLALNITDYDAIFENIDTLTTAFAKHILMLKDQIIDSQK
ncbi:MAG: hypothetical protein RLZZ292_3212 [Bacteroidota bacterium]|jgi:hypothetical protein